MQEQNHATPISIFTPRNNKYRFSLEFAFIVLTFVLLPLFSPPFFHPEEHSQIFLLTIITSCWCISRVFSLNHPIQIKISLTDIFVLFYLVYGIIHSTWIKPTVREFPLYLEWISLILLYILARSTTSKIKQYLQISIIISSTCQAIIGVIQYYHLLPSNHNWFSVTGSFPNPGPYGGFLAIGFVICLAYMLKNLNYKKQPIRTFLTCSSFSLILVALILSDSRAAWLGCIIASGYVLHQQLKTNHVKYKLPVYWKIIIFTLMVILISFLYLYKQPSANTRLFIWQVSSNMFIASPLTGTGIGTFPSNYIEYQATYLSQHPDSPHATTADNNHLAFNEFLHVACEQGIIGLILFLAIIISVFKPSINNSEFKAAFVALLVFSCFSYPAEIISLKILFPLFLGEIKHSPIPQFQRFVPYRRDTIIPVGLITMIVLQYACIHSWNSYHQAFHLLNDTNNSGTIKSEQIEYYAKRLNNPNYLFLAGNFFFKNGQIEKTIFIWQQLEHLRPSTPLACKLGQAYRLKGDTCQARKYFQKGHQMTPAHIQPLYELFTTYLHSNQKQEAKNIARQITALKVNITNSITLKAKKEANDFLK